MDVRVISSDRGIGTMLGLCTAILVVAALYLGRSIFAPVVFALFIIAVVWPVQRTLQARIPKLLALGVTILVTLGVILLLVSVVGWALTRVGQWLVDNSARFQTLYSQQIAWLDARGVALPALVAEHFDVRWLLRMAGEIKAAVRDGLTFSVLTSVFVILGLLEVDEMAERLRRIQGGERPNLLSTGASIAAKFQKYMLVRSVMSVATGLVIWGFAMVAGLELAAAWGVLAFVLNYIPFVGPLIATVLPTVFAAAQSESWQMPLVVFLCLNIIQFLSGSYIEPRIAGSTLSLSPFMIMFAVFFGAFVWGIPGAFIGVPVLIALVTAGELFPSGRRLSALVSGGGFDPSTASSNSS